MTDQQWKDLLAIIEGAVLDPPPVGFIIDSPWLPNWFGRTILDYYTSDDVWLQANLEAVRTFPEVMFLPGFWSEYGMCTEPSAFGTRCSFPPDAFPHAYKIMGSISDVSDLPAPDARTDGLFPFMLNRLVLLEPAIREAGHQIKFSVSRGPLNVASYLMGTTELMIALLTDPGNVHVLMDKITLLLKQWHDLQQETFPSIDGIFLLDDVIGFISGEHFETFGLPYFKTLFDRDVAVKFLHNDAPCKASVQYLPEMGVNLFNMGFDTDLNELKDITGYQTAMLGNIPPRDVLAQGDPSDVERVVKELKAHLKDRKKVVFSCGGGMPPGVSTENIRTFIQTVQNGS